MQEDRKIGVALSGGGYRAAAFHIGTLKKLHDLGVLKKVDVLSTISGGSITGAAYCLDNSEFTSFQAKIVSALNTKSVIRYILTFWVFIRTILFCLLFIGASIWLYHLFAPAAFVPILLLAFLITKYQFKIFPVSEIIEKAYDDFFYQQKYLSDLCDKPELAIGATNLQTSRHFTFSKRKMEDSAYAYYNPPITFDGSKFPLARAVMASSSVPFAFTPVSINREFFRDEALASKVDPKLVDGGVYDNQGIHKLTQDNSSYACEIVIVSDAGNLLPFKKSYNNTYTLLLRTVNTFMVRIKNFQMMQNIFQVPNKREIAYLSLGWDLENCLSGFYNNLVAGNILSDVLNRHKLPEEWLKFPKDHKEEILTFIGERCHINEILAKGLPADRLKKIRNVGTNLTRLKLSLINDLIIHAENLTEMQVRLYCPSLIEQ